MSKKVLVSNDFWEHDAAKFVYDRWQRNRTSYFDRKKTQNFLQRSFKGCQGKLLDIGCGPGFWLRQEFLSNFTVQIGIDCSNAMVKLANEAGIKAIMADAHALPFEDNQFDAVMSIHVLEYSSNPQQFLREARRVLRPGGRCCIVTKNKFGFPWQWANQISEKTAPNPLTFHCLTIDEVASLWGSAPLDVSWISARIITNLNDVNDAVHSSFPAWVEESILVVAKILQPILTWRLLGKLLAWHMGIVLEKEIEPTGSSEDLS